MLSLSSLAGWEEAVLASIAGTSGPVHERDRQIERSGMYGEYPAIVHAYQELFTDPDSAVEALKRAVFLVWRAAIAAPSDTGIPPLPDGTVRAVIDELQARARREEMDDEQCWMLAWYHAQNPLWLDVYGATPALLHVASSYAGDEWVVAGIDHSAMRRRGQMGRYWSALAAGGR